MMGDTSKQIKGRDRKKGRCKMEVRNRKRLVWNEDRNEDSNGTREDRGKQYRFGGRDRAGDKGMV